MTMTTTSTDGFTGAARTVAGTWHGGYHCTVEAGGHTIHVDEPAGVGGTDLGPQPTDLFLASIASCFTLALSHAARRRSIELSGLAVNVTGRYDGLRFSSVHVRASIGAPPEEIDGLVLAAERVCYVTNSLRSGVGLSTEAVVAEP
jgi:uncharacterized OsmC-like protein